MKKVFASFVVVAAALVASGCSNSSSTSELSVSAASSLTGSFTQLAKMFETAHPGVTVKLNFGASSALAEQINAGAPVDVFAAASPTTMKTAVDAGNVQTPVAFTTNTLELAVPQANPAKISSVADLAKPGTKLVVCVKEAPCGTAAEKLLANARLTVTPVSLEPDVKSVLAKVAANEADAGIVYVTDVKAAGSDVTGIEIPSDVNVSSEYQIGMTDRNAELAKQFVEFVQSDAGQQVLSDAGFARAS